MVEANTRGAGVGALLVERFAAIARLHGTRRLRLYTSCDNEPAKRFYERLRWRFQTGQADTDGKLWTPFIVVSGPRVTAGTVIDTQTVLLGLDRKSVV